MEKQAFDGVELLKNFSRTGEHADKFNNEENGTFGFTNKTLPASPYLKAKIWFI